MITDGGIIRFAEFVMTTTLRDYKLALIYERKHHKDYIEISLLLEELKKYNKQKSIYKKALSRKNRTEYEQKLVKGFMHKKKPTITKKQRAIYKKYITNVELIDEIETFYLNGGLEKWSIGKIKNPELFISKVKTLVEKEIQK